MGPREKKLRESAAVSFPPDGSAYFDDFLAQHTLACVRVLDALEEALNGWEDAAQYKGEFLAKKHGDADDIARLRKVLEESDDS